MRNNVLSAIGGLIVGALLVFLYFTGLAPLTGGRPGPCPGNPHCIAISVSAGVIAQIPDHQVHDAGAVIYWYIATAGYSFPDKGIDFYPTPPKPAPNQAPPGEFKNCGPMPQDNTTYKCIDAYHTMGKFGYTVTLNGSPAVTPLDPYVINN
jgi:hypothetical protein